MSQTTTVVTFHTVQEEESTLYSPKPLTSIYEASKEFYRVERQITVLAGYVRNSDPSKKDSEVLKAQKEALQAYALSMGIELPDHLIYTDAISALKYPYWERPGLMQLWDDAEVNRFDGVLCTEFFRLARKSSEQYAIIEYLKRFHVTVISIAEKFGDTAEGRLLHAVQGFLGEVEAEKTRIRTSRGKLHRARIALTGQGERTYGYKFADTDEYRNGRYVLNGDIVAVINGQPWTEIDVLNFEKQLCLQGVSTNSIALTLTRMGIPTQTGKQAWNRATVLQHLTNGNYRGYPYAANNRYTREGHKTSVKRTSEDELIPLPQGIVPRIVEPQEFDAIQEQLRRNQEMAARNNHHPNLSLLRSGLVFCGICNRRMCVHHHTKPHSTEIQGSEYECRRNEGTDELKRHHCVTIGVHLLDPSAWEFAIPYIQNPCLIRQRIETLRGQLRERNHVEALEATLTEIRKKIVNLFALGEDIKDEEIRKMHRERLAALEHDKRETERLIARLSNTQEREEKLRAALDKFEAWAERIRTFLDDPNYQVTPEDKRAAFIILGVQATVWPSEGYPERVRLELAPPDIKRYCDFDRVTKQSFLCEAAPPFLSSPPCIYMI